MSKDKMRILIVNYDNESSVNTLPLGALYVAGYLRANGFEDIEYYSQDIYRYPESHLTSYLNENHFDVVGLGYVAGYFQHKKIKAICDAIRKADNRPFIVLGGHGPTPVPEFSIKAYGADAVVLGEGEIPFLNLVKALANNDSLGGVKGIAYRAGAEVVVNEREKPIKSLDALPHPYIEPLPMEYYINKKFLQMKPVDRMMYMITSRGCNYRCNFCQRLEKGIRFRSAEAVIDELKKYIRDYGITYVVFWDELFMFSEKRVVSICEAILRENIKINFWCTGRLNTVNETILDILKQAGCTYIDYGIEQFDNHALKAMNKKLTEEDIVRGIELTQQKNIYVAFNIIFGNVGDTKDSLRKSLDLLKSYNDYGQLRVIRPVTPYPGSDLYYTALERGLLNGPEDFYEKHKNVELLTCNFTDMPDDEFYEVLLDANREIINDYYEYMKKENIRKFQAVYSGQDYSFRGARH